MSLVLKMLRAFPKGRTTEELLVLIGASFSHDKRVATLAEVDQLLADGHIQRDASGRWKAQTGSPFPEMARTTSLIPTGTQEDPLFLHGSAAEFHLSNAKDFPEAFDEDDDEAIDAKQLLQYWRASLRADPRGATTQVVDKHGLEWQMISGRGPIVFEMDTTLEIKVRFEALSATFQEALMRR